jgi:hypothetical protein
MHRLGTEFYRGLERRKKDLIEIQGIGTLRDGLNVWGFL